MLSDRDQLLRQTERQPGDVLDYIPDGGRHCREGIAIVNERGDAVDTFWDSGSESHLLTEAELATAGLRFRLGDYRELGKTHWDRGHKDTWLTYAPADRQVTTAQHGLQSTLYVRNGAEPDLDTQIANAREAVQEAEHAVGSAQSRLEWRREDLAKLEAARV
jgi:hypothetical protein